MQKNQLLHGQGNGNDCMGSKISWAKKEWILAQWINGVEKMIPGDFPFRDVYAEKSF